MKNKILFSIVTTFKNDVSVLSRTYSSLTKQKFKNFEWLIINGGNQKIPLELFDAINKNIQFVKYFNLPASSIGSAWNFGINKSKGLYISFLNCGDEYHKSLLSSYSSIINKHQYDLISSSIEIFNEDLTFHSIWRPSFNKIKYGMSLPHITSFMRLEIIRNLNGFSMDYHSLDYELFLRFYLKYSFNNSYILNKQLAKFYLGGISDKNYIKSLWYNLRIQKDLLNYPLFFLYMVFCFKVIKIFFIYRLISFFKKIYA